MKGGVGAIVLGQSVLWLRGPEPSRFDAEELMQLWRSGRAELRRGTHKYERAFEAFGAGLRAIGLEGARPGPADWLIVLADPPPGMWPALVSAAVMRHPGALAPVGTRRSGLTDREVYPELYQ